MSTKNDLITQANKVLADIARLKGAGASVIGISSDDIEYERLLRKKAQLRRDLAPHGVNIDELYAENKPGGTWRCLACWQLWDGSQLHLSISGRGWTCGNYLCGGNCTPASNDKGT